MLAAVFAYDLLTACHALTVAATNAVAETIPLVTAYSLWGLLGPRFVTLETSAPTTLTRCATSLFGKVCSHATGPLMVQQVASSIAGHYWRNLLVVAAPFLGGT